jgi:hypothetical protein
VSACLGSPLEASKLSSQKDKHVHSLLLNLGGLGDTKHHHHKPRSTSSTTLAPQRQPDHNPDINASGSKGDILETPRTRPPKPVLCQHSGPPTGSPNESSTTLLQLTCRRRDEQCPSSGISQLPPPKEFPFGRASARLQARPDPPSVHMTNARPSRRPPPLVIEHSETCQRRRGGGWVGDESGNCDPLASDSATRVNWR